MSASAEENIRGTVMRSTGSWYRVRLSDGTQTDARLRGRFRTEGIKSTNPIAVGDHVLLSREDQDFVITDILDRKNYILRKAVNLSKRSHILCCNIDQALILFTLAQPLTTLGYIDRLLVSCEAYGIPAVLVFNKTDLLTTAEMQARLADYMGVYEKAGYRCVSLNATDSTYAQEIKDLLRGKVNCVVGRSGAGKSSMVNLADPTLDLKTGGISDFSGRGKHTTTFAEMHELSFGGFIIDSPGFKEMEIIGIEKNELAHFFPEFRARMADCRFSNCHHSKEPGCAVKAAVESGEIAQSRYHTYLSMLAGIDESPEAQ